MQVTPLLSHLLSESGILSRVSKRAGGFFAV